MNPILSFVSGIVAAFTPCIVVLIPILLYRFFNNNKKQYKEFILLSIGFLSVFILVGFILGQLFTSQIQSGIRVALGLLFIVLGILAIFNKINPQNFPVFKNPLLLGASFALALAVNPCTIPYISVIISIASNAQILLNMVLFGIGLLIPSILFAIFGSKIFSFAKRNKRTLHLLNKFMSITLVVAGTYMIYTIKSFTLGDVVIVSLMLIFIFILLLRAFYLVIEIKDLKSLKVILLIIALLIIIATAIFHCKSIITSENANALSCSVHGFAGCEVCKRCISMFSAALIIGFIGSFLVKKTTKE